MPNHQCQSTKRRRQIHDAVGWAAGRASGL